MDTNKKIKPDDCLTASYLPADRLPVCCLEKNANNIVNSISSCSPLFIEQGGTVKAVLLDIKEYEDELESIAKLRLILRDILNR